MAGVMKKQRTGPRALQGTDQARRTAAIMLEALSGLRTTQAAANELGIALARYYVLEKRALQAMVEALEPRARGRQRGVEAEMRLLQEDNARLSREVLRTQALYRVAQQAIGLDKGDGRKARRSKGKAAAAKTRRVRRVSRGERIVKSLRASTDAASSQPDKLVLSKQETQGQGADRDGTS